MRKILKRILRLFGLEIKKYKENIDETGFVSLEPDKASRGNVLLAYIIDPFLLKAGESISNTHTHFWESLQIAQTYLDLGYAVDVISYRNTTFVPSKDYSIFVAARTNFAKIAKRLNDDCFKVAYLDTAHWLFNNNAAYKRLFAVQQRKRMTVESNKMVEPNRAIEYADCAIILGNDFTIGTYQYAQKEIYPIHIPTCTLYPWAEDKDFENCRKNFLWFGSRGLVHKGLDLALEAFAEMPDYHLTVCGPVQEEKDFEQAFYKELYQTPNIQTVGWVDVSGPEFLEIAQECVGLVYPSCSEGQSGAVATCLQAGLIPVISYESGFDVDDFGLILEECSIEKIKDSVQEIANLSAQELEAMARKAWQYARENHSRSKYAEEYRRFTTQSAK